MCLSGINSNACTMCTHWLCLKADWAVYLVSILGHSSAPVCITSVSQHQLVSLHLFQPLYILKSFTISWNWLRLDMTASNFIYIKISAINLIVCVGVYFICSFDDQTLFTCCQVLIKSWTLIHQVLWFTIVVTHLSFC